MNDVGNLPRGVPRAVVLAAIVMVVALVGGIWEASAQDADGLCLDAAPLSEAEAQHFLDIQGPGGQFPCGVFSVCSHGTKIIPVQDHPMCTGQSLTVYCMDNQGVWTNTNVSNVSVSGDGTAVTFVASQHGTCGLFLGGVTTPQGAVAPEEGVVQPVCGDGTCQGGETPDNCPADCWATCGDGQITHLEECESDSDCEGNGHCANCYCVPRCGNGFCEDGLGETSVNCPEDCLAECGDGAVTREEECEDHSDCAFGFMCYNCRCFEADTDPSGDGTCGNSYCDPWEGDGICDCDCEQCGDGVCVSECERPWCERDCD